MKMRLSACYFLIILALAGLFSCENRQPENTDKPTPQVFTPAPDTNNETSADSLPNQPDSSIRQAPLDDPKPMPAGDHKPMPTVAELKKITPSQEAKRALSNDAMQIFRMKPEEFKSFLKSRVPYYKGKGDLKAENDRVRIEVNSEEMRVQTPKETYSFSMR